MLPDAVSLLSRCRLDARSRASDRSFSSFEFHWCTWLCVLFLAIFHRHINGFCRLTLNLMLVPKLASPYTHHALPTPLCPLDFAQDRAGAPGRAVFASVVIAGGPAVTVVIAAGRSAESLGPPGPPRWRGAAAMRLARRTLTLYARARHMTPGAGRPRRPETDCVRRVTGAP